MNIGISIFLFIFNFLVYFGGSALVFKRRKFTSISIRSPIMIFINNLCGFFIGSIIIIHFIIREENSCREGWQYFFGTLYWFQFIMIITFLLRYQRVLYCCQIDTDERIDNRQYTEKKSFYTQEFYIKILFWSTIAIALVIIIVSVITTINMNILTCTDDNTGFVSKSFSWLFINFVWLLALITYAYLMSIYDVKQKMHIEAGLYAISCFLFFNFISLYDVLSTRFLNEIITLRVSCKLLALISLYGSLGINSFFPVVLSYLDKTSIGFHFNPKSMNNLFLFLSNEHCYASFSSYLSKSHHGTYYLRLYTQIIKFKLKIINKKDFNDLVQEATLIHQQHFNQPNSLLTEATIKQIKEAFADIGNAQDGIKEDIFDDALLESFTHLSKRFAEFKKRDEFSSLNEILNLNSYIQCKMSNTGLIKKY